MRGQDDELVDAARAQLQHALRVARVVEAGLAAALRRVSLELVQRGVLRRRGAAGRRYRRVTRTESEDIFICEHDAIVSHLVLTEEWRRH